MNDGRNIWRRYHGIISYNGSFVIPENDGVVATDLPIGVIVRLLLLFGDRDGASGVYRRLWMIQNISLKQGKRRT